MRSDEVVGEEVREVYARFGLAMYFAQVLEHGLVAAMCILKFMPEGLKNYRSEEQWEAEFDAYFDSHFECTMGTMMKSFRRTVDVPDDLEQLLVAALKKRNWLAHEFFRAHAINFMSAEGRETMISEVDACRAQFRELDDRLSMMIKPICEKYGLTDERIAEELAAMQRGGDAAS